MAVDPNWFLRYEENKYEVPYGDSPLGGQRITVDGECFEAQNAKLKENWEKDIPRMILCLVQFEYIVTEFNLLNVNRFKQYLGRLKSDLKFVEAIHKQAEFIESHLYDQAAKAVDKCYKAHNIRGMDREHIEDDLAYFQIKIEDYCTIINDLYRRIHVLQGQLDDIMASRHMNNMTHKAMSHKHKPSRLDLLLRMGPHVNVNAFYRANALRRAPPRIVRGTRRTKSANRTRSARSVKRHSYN